MFILQVPPTSLIHKMTKKTSAGQILYRTLGLHFYGGGNIHIDRDIKKEALLTFLRGQDACHGSSEFWPALN